MNALSAAAARATVRTTPGQDLALLLARAVVGVVLVAHGWQKVDQGIGATADGFASLGIPAATAAAWFAVSVELVGGVLLVLGLVTRLVALLVVADMAGAFWFAHRGTEVFVTDGGWELVAVIAAAALALVAAGAGRLSLDGAVAAAASRRTPQVEREAEPSGSASGSATGSATRSAPRS